MLYMVVFMIQAIRAILLPYLAAIGTLAAYDAAWLARTCCDLVIPHFGGKMYA